MYDFVDRPLGSQPEGVRLVVWSMRQWVTAALEGRCVCGLMGCAFASVDAEGAAGPFRDTMQILCGDLRIPLRFGAIACQQIAEHEAVLLGALTASTQGRAQDCAAVARLLVQPDKAEALAAALGRLAGALAGAELHLAAPYPRPGHAG